MRKGKRPKPDPLRVRNEIARLEERLGRLSFKSNRRTSRAEPSDQVREESLEPMKKPSETETGFGQFTGRAIDALALWADTNQKALQGLAEFSANAVREGLRLYAELQSSGFEAMKEGQSYWFRRISELGDLPKDPFGWYQKSMIEGMEVTQKALTRLMKTNVQTMARLQASAQRTNTEIQQNLATLTERMQL